MNKSDQVRFKKIWKLHGVPFSDGGNGSSKRTRWIAYVNGLHVLKILEASHTALLTEHVHSGSSNNWTSYELDEIQQSAWLRKVERLAIRAGYAIGVPASLVSIGRDEKGRPCVTDIQVMTSIQMKKKMNRSSILPLLKEKTCDTSVVMFGADVELIIRRPDGTVVPAEQFLPKGGKAGCDPARWEGTLGYPLLELRPDPSEEPVGLIRNLHRCAQIAARRIGNDNLYWQTGGMPVEGFPLGGHIHISGVELNERLLRALDNYVALPLVMLEDRSSMRRRPKFGFLGDFRRKSHGGFEYRTLPSWLHTPRLALSVILLIKLVVDHYEQLKQRPLHEVTVQQHYYTGNKRLLLPYVKLIWSDLESLPDYNAERKHFEALRSKCEGGSTWICQQDVKASWKVKR